MRGETAAASRVYYLLHLNLGEVGTLGMLRRFGHFSCNKSGSAQADVDEAVFEVPVRDGQCVVRKSLCIQGRSENVLSAVAKLLSAPSNGFLHGTSNYCASSSIEHGCNVPRASSALIYCVVFLQRR